ncbi:C40 family peptidase [Sporosarcina sp. YIM B06819]|uniref:C40 family peptidase n=1 Tax=Sporosarcina sp. YIM B06819 TaxID=3081769 RepID=UPI00298C56EA|nr:C40 family peptidase [Sporosarcina sp. YIM B06819]
MWYCAVPVATVWTSPESVRDVDQDGIKNPVQLTKWLEQLPFAVRLDLCDGNRVQTQLLYGEPVIIEEIQGDWAKIIAVWQPSKKDERGYPGWVPLVQLKEAKPIHAQGFAKVTAGKAQLWQMDGSPSIVIPFNAMLPYTGELGDYVRVCTPDGEAKLLMRDVETAPSIHLFDKKPASEAVTKGLAFLDLPYFWGGMSSYGYDCSGFTYSMLKACGYTIPRDADDQARGGEGIPVYNPTRWKKGDLLFFANDQGKGNVRHVGFYYGDGLLLHSPSTGKSIELLKLEGSGLKSELCAVRRYGMAEGERV